MSWIEATKFYRFATSNSGQLIGLRVELATGAQAEVTQVLPSRHEATLVIAPVQNGGEPSFHTISSLRTGEIRKVELTDRLLLGYQEHRWQEELEKYRVHYLYHITHIDNIRSIVEHGLLSHNSVHIALSPTDISDPEVNQRRTRQDPIYHRPLHDYVPTYFAASNPMLYKRRELRFQLAILCIDPMLLASSGAIFSDGNAASNDSIFYGTVEDLEKLYWECLQARYWHQYHDGKRFRCAEALIPNSVSRNYIKKIAVLPGVVNRLPQVVRDAISVETNRDLFRCVL